MDGVWNRIDTLLQGVATEWQLLILAAVLGAGYVLRWLVERHTLEYQHRQKINETLAEKLHEYTHENYGPTINLISRLVTSLDKLVVHLGSPPCSIRSPEDPEDEQEAHEHVRFVQPLRLILSILAKNRKSSMIFLRSLRGEEVVYFIWQDLKETLTGDECLTVELCTTILDGEAIFQSDRQFLQRPQPSEVVDAMKRFACWARSNPKAVRTLQRRLRCFWEVHLFEINRSHRGWYRRNQPAELTWEELAELNLLLRKLEEKRIEEGRRWGALPAFLARKRYLGRLCGLRGLQPESWIQNQIR